MQKNRDYPLHEAPELGDLQVLVRHVAQAYGDRPAFTFRRGNQIDSVSYRQFKADVDALGTALVDAGLTGHVAVIGKNSYEWILTYFAVANAGQVIVPLDPELNPNEISALLMASDCTVLVYDDDYAHIAAELNAGLDRVPMSQFPSLIERGLALIASGDFRMVETPVDPLAMMAILYTSGTTGSPKGVMLTHRSIAVDTVNTCRQEELIGRHLQVLPLHHSFGFICVPVMLLKNCEICLNSSLKRLPTDLKQFRPQLLVVVPLFVETFYRQVWDMARTRGKAGLLRVLVAVSNGLLRFGIDLRRHLFKSVLVGFGGNLKTVVSGGAPLDEQYIQGFRHFGVELVSGYGITECSPIVSANRNYHFRNGSVGRPLPGIEVKILNPNADGTGEIAVKGDAVMLGYYNDDQATREAFDGGWFKTGDTGHVDADGFLYVTGRKKNLIILSNGKNVAAEELEAAIHRAIPYVLETVVYAEDNAITAEVYLDPDVPGAASRLPADIVALNRVLTSYKNIGRTVVRDTEFPKTTTKKIKRRQ